MSTAQTLIVLAVAGAVVGGVTWYVYEYYNKQQQQQYPEGAVVRCDSGAHSGAIAKMTGGKFSPYANMDVYTKNGSPPYQSIADCDKFQWGAQITS